MQYFEIFDLRGEPFSNSPDPEFFFESEGHKRVLHNLEIALRLRRGLNVVLGEVGTGKTTLCRRLLRELAGDGKVEAHLLLDPDCGGTDEFLTMLRDMLCGGEARKGASRRELKEDIKNTLFEKGVDEERTVVLIIDEGQKISAESLEVLRELLNYETNDFKLLQIILFAQNEFQEQLDAAPNLADRVNALFRLGPLDFKGTRAMVRHRLRCAAGGHKPRDMFTGGAYRALYKATGGYPRRIIRLCHKVVLALIMQDRKVASGRMVRACAREDRPERSAAFMRPMWAYSIAAAALAVALFAVLRSGPMAGAVVQSPAVQTVQEPAPLPAPEPAAVAAKAGSGVAEPEGGEPAAVQPGEIMGAVVVGEGESISSVLYELYGWYEPSMAEKVLAANPGLSNPDMLGVGDKVVIPEPEWAAKNVARRMWLEIAETRTLGEAWASRRGARSLGFDARVLPHFDEAGQRRFAVAIAPLYDSRAEASEALALVEASRRGLLGVNEGRVAVVGN